MELIKVKLYYVQVKYQSDDDSCNDTVKKLNDDFVEIFPLFTIDRDGNILLNKNYYRQKKHVLSRAQEKIEKCTPYEKKHIFATLELDPNETELEIENISSGDDFSFFEHAPI